MPESIFPLVDATEITRLVGRNAFERGQAYFRQGAVVDVSWNPDTRVVSALVQGSAPDPYACSVTLGTTVAGSVRSSACATAPSASTASTWPPHSSTPTRAP
jgi:uncharacterized Zn finger protein